MCALIVPSGGLISQVNGTVDNKVYYRGRWGNVVRTWVDPANTITPQRTAIRALFASLQSLFNSLTPDMQDDWNTFAGSLVNFNRLAQPYIPTGLQTFMQRNINLDMISAGPLLFPPNDEFILPVISYTCSLATIGLIALNGIYTNNTNTTPSPYYTVIYSTDNQSPGKSFMSNRYHVTTYILPGVAFSLNLYPEWQTAWAPSTLLTGQKLFFKTLTINGNTGQASKPAFCSQIIS